MKEQTLVVRKRLTDLPRESWEIASAVKHGAYEGLRKTVSQFHPEQVTQLVKESGLRGRGGAGSPTGTKWEFVPRGSGEKYVVANDDEGEPGSFNDREITEGDPHAIIEGALITAYAVGAQAVYIYVRGEFGVGLHRLDQAIGDARARGFVGNNILGSGFDCEVHTHPGAGAYICGEETALLDSLEGFRGQPRIRPPYPAIEGLYGKPTVINNVETLATIPHIVRNGAQWFRSMGTEKSPGTKSFSVSGAVSDPGNYEFELGTNLADILEAAGGLTNGEFKGVIPGGASSPWLTTLDIAMDFETLMDAGSMLGSGAIVFMDTSTCVVDVAFSSARFFNHESCGKCTPCREGTWWGLRVMERIARGEGRPEDLDLLIDVCGTMSEDGPLYYPKGQSFCGLGDGAAWSLRSAIKLFREDFEEHIRTGDCPQRVARV